MLQSSSEHSVEMSAKFFSELKLVTDNLLSIYAAANWEATENLLGSGVAKLGHTEAHDLTTRGYVPPVQVLLKLIIGANVLLSIVNRTLNVHKLSCTV